MQCKWYNRTIIELYNRTTERTTRSIYGSWERNYKKVNMYLGLKCWLGLCNAERRKSYITTIGCNSLGDDNLCLLPYFWVTDFSKSILWVVPL